ncbi:MAG: twin-arginine translocation signal domain-containing protein [Actinobacteria bacterium]|nr:twin-arginine translocation signal domain-containing protein [Actinomycetota bacterium]
MASPSSTSRRTFLQAGAAGLAGVGLAGCGVTPRRRETTEHGTTEQPGSAGTAGESGGDHASGQLSARPGPVTSAAPATGLQPLGIDTDRDALLYVPDQVTPGTPAPMVLLLHGAGGTAEAGLAPLLDLAGETGLVLLSPPARDRTWDVLLGGYGPDIAFIDRALEATFARQTIDPDHLAIGGFSDGASYALSVGLVNGTLFSHIVAFSPGFVAPGPTSGSPRVFVSHGTADDVLPIGATSRRIVPRLEQDGYEVRYREFEGGHAVPPAIAGEALDWFLGPGD